MRGFRLINMPNQKKNCLFQVASDQSSSCPSEKESNELANPNINI